MSYESNSGPVRVLAVGDSSRVDYRDGTVYITTDGVTLQLSPRSFYELSGTLMLASRNFARLSNQRRNDRAPDS